MRGKYTNRLVVCLLVVFCCPLFTPSASAAEAKIGYVNLAKIFDGYQRTKVSDAALEKKGKQKEAELQDRVSELNQMKQSLELLNDAAREAKAKQIADRQDDLQRFRNSTARDLRWERDKVAQDILKDIQQAINDYAKANGFALIVDERALLYGAQAFDLTDQVLKILNSKAAAAR